MVTTEDLPYIISDVLHHDTMADQRIRILNYSLSLAQGLKPVATLKIEINGEAYQESASGDGQYDAFVRALRKIYTDLGRPFPMLTNYSVSIPPADGLMPLCRPSLVGIMPEWILKPVVLMQTRQRLLSRRH